MAQSLARLHVHLIFSTKNREPLLTGDIQPQMHAYMATVLKEKGCYTQLINSVEDHVHILFELCRTESLSDVVEHLKRTTSKWVKTQGSMYSNFAWQTGYGAFSVSESSVSDVRDYIAKQQEHHRKTSFKDEFRAFLKKHGIQYDETYVWG